MIFGRVWSTNRCAAVRSSCGYSRWVMFGNAKSVPFMVMVGYGDGRLWLWSVMVMAGVFYPSACYAVMIVISKYKARIISAPHKHAMLCKG